jgi:hypothetical protein
MYFNNFEPSKLGLLILAIKILAIIVQCEVGMPVETETDVRDLRCEPIIPPHVNFVKEFAAVQLPAPLSCAPQPSPPRVNYIKPRSTLSCHSYRHSIFTLIKNRSLKLRQSGRM